MQFLFMFFHQKPEIKINFLMPEIRRMLRRSPTDLWENIAYFKCASHS